MGQQSLIYSFVERGTVILSEFYEFTGNFTNIASQCLCKACKPEVEMEALWIQGPKLDTVMSQVKRLEVSVLVLGQKKPSSLLTSLCGRSSREKFVEECINNVECLIIGVRKQRQGIGGYLISTIW